MYGEPVSSISWSVHLPEEGSYSRSPPLPVTLVDRICDNPWGGITRDVLGSTDAEGFTEYIFSGKSNLAFQSIYGNTGSRGWTEAFMKFNSTATYKGF